MQLGILANKNHQSDLPIIIEEEKEMQEKQRPLDNRQILAHANIMDPEEP